MRALWIAFVLAVIAAPAFAQSNLGELLDQGAKKIGKEEYLKGIPKTFSGITSTGRADVNLTYRPDGSLIGNIRALQSGSTSGVSGSWTVDDSGKICIKEIFHAWNQTYEACGYEFLLNGQLWAARSDVDRSAGIFKLNYKKE